MSETIELPGDTSEADTSSLQSYAENVTIIDPKERNAFIVGVACTIKDFEFDLDHLCKEPWSKGKFLKPSRNLMKKELNCRKLPTKGILNYTISELIAHLSFNNTLSDVDKDYCLAELEKIKENINNAANDKKETKTRISLNDRLRFIHCLLSDEVRPVYETSQATLTREQLDARNLTNRCLSYEDVLTEKFNDENFIPNSVELGHLHSSFNTSFPLPLQDWKCTPEKCKDVMMGLKTKLVDIQVRFEQSGNGDGMMRKDDTDSDSDNEVDTLLNGCDIANFLRNPKDTYVVYWWYLLSDAGLLQFSLTMLPQGMVSNSKMTTCTTPSKKNKNESTQAHMNKVETEMKRMGDELSSFSFVALTEKKDDWEEKVMEIEINKISQNREYTLYEKRLNKLKSYIADIEEEIVQVRKRIKRVRVSSPNRSTSNEDYSIAFDIENDLL